METYIALLKGINVGGKNIIKMDALRSLMAGLGYKDVRTYIQSGNIIFASTKKEIGIMDEIQAGIRKVFDVSADVIIRAARDFYKTIENCPAEYIVEQEAADASNANKLYAGMAPAPLLPKDAERLNKYKGENEDYKISGRDIYFWLGNGAGRSKLFQSLSGMETPVTVRNWKTIKKLVQMAGENP